MLWLRLLFVPALIALSGAPALAQSQFMVDFERFRTPEAPPLSVPPPPAPPAPTPPAVRLPPPQPEAAIRCENTRAIRGEPPSDLWRSLGTMRQGNSLCNIWHVGGEYNMTNCHCIQGSRNISVRFNRGSRYFSSQCRPVGCQSALDYAVVRCPGQSGVEPVKFTDSRFQINIDHEVHLLTYDVARSFDAARFSKGLVLQKLINADGGARMQEFTSSAQGGNSGSAVFNKNGEVTCLLHSIDENFMRRSGYSNRSYCTNIHSVLENMAAQGGEMALARRAIEHSQNAIRLADRTCTAPPVAGGFNLPARGLANR